MGKSLFVVIILALTVALMPIAPPSFAAIDLSTADYNLDVVVNGSLVDFPDQKPFIDAAIGSTYVPLRFVSEALGCEINWDEENQKIQITKDLLSIELIIGSNISFIVNDGVQRAVVIAPPELVNERTLVPLRFISEVLGAEVDYTPAEEGNKSRIDVNEKPADTIVADTRIVTMETSKGNIVVEIYPKLMPITAGNFEKLVEESFYNGLTFHRVEEWVIQGGDPQGNGMGGPGWSIPLEISFQLKNTRGALAMARSSDPNSAGSQFYILKKDEAFLDGQYAVFGRVIEGMDIVDKITIGDKMISVK